ncbi:MAG TPA: multiheme c-type cytochrome [Bryobacteraceae bacterium]
MTLLLLLTTFAYAASPKDCAPCHKAETSAFEQAGMTRALSAATATQTDLATQLGGYSYRIAGDTYIVSDGKETLSVPLQWVFGQGTTGQTYVFQRDGRWYESRVSWFAALHGLDLTIGMQNITPHNLTEAAGRLASMSEINKCFDCHATGVTKTDLSHLIPGVQCERCHGATTAHLANNAPMRKLSATSAEEMSDFCGQCHRTWSDIAANGPRGILNIRFQPYRLALSKCYDVSDNRIRCTSCHDPHRAVQTSAAAYDGKCLACHASKPCRNGQTTNCVSCHMPKLELPGAHKKFTDHKIRIVKAHEPYPD